MTEQDFVYEINPITKTIKKIELTRDISYQLGELTNFQIKGTYMNLCYDKSLQEDQEWTLKLKKGQCGCTEDLLKRKFKGVCYLAGKTFRVEGQRWKVLAFPKFYDMYIIDDRYKEWIKF